MAGSVNTVILEDLGRDPEARYTQSNQKIVHLSVAASRSAGWTASWATRASGRSGTSGDLQ